MADKTRESGDLTLIGAGAILDGKLKTEGSIRIDGKFVGEISAKADAAIGASGSVEGTLAAKNVTVAGKANGNVMAAEKLILEAKSITRGDIRAARLVVDEGAMFDGRCNMTGSAQPEHPKQPS